MFNHSFTAYAFLGGGGGMVVTLSSLASIFGECSTIHSLPALFFLFFFFFFLSLKVEISSRTLIPHFRPGLVHSGSVS